MEVVERKRSRGGFLNLFDWPGKSRKKLFSSGSSVLSETKQTKQNAQNLSSLSLIEVDEGSKNLSYNPRSESSCCASSVTSDEEGHGTRAPSVVARLMGLESLPVPNVQEPRFNPDLDPFFLRPSRNTSKWNAYENLGYVNLRSDYDGVSWEHLDSSRTSDGRSRPIERFQSETFPPRAAKPICVTNNRLLSPIRSPGFVPSRNPVYVMEAASRMIEPSPRVAARTRFSQPSNSPSSVPMRIQDLREKLEAAQKVSSRKHNEKRASASVMTPSTSNSKLNSSSDGLKRKAKPPYVPAQAKASSTPLSASRSQKEKAEAKNGLVKSQNGLRGTSINTGKSVLKQNYQKQNCRDNQRSVTSASNQKGSNVVNKVVNKVPVSKQQGPTTALAGKNTSLSLSRKKTLPRSKKPPNGMQGTGISDDKRIKRNENVIKCNITIDKTGKDDRKKEMDVISFTFSSPIKGLSSDSLSSTQGVDQDTDSAVSFDMFGGDSLNVLLEKKLRELTSKLESSSCSLTQEESSSANDGVNGKSTQNGLDTVLSESESVSDCTSVYDKQRFQIIQAEELEVSSISTVTEADDLRSSCSKGFADCRQITEHEIKQSSRDHEFTWASSAQEESELSESVVTLAYSEDEERLDWELEYISEILSSDQLMVKEFALGMATDILPASLFDEIEGRGEATAAKLRRRTVFDFVNNSLALKCEQMVRGTCRGILGKEGILFEHRDWLAEELNREVHGLKKMREMMMDELVDKEMSSLEGCWLHFEKETYEEGIDIEGEIVSTLVDDLVNDLVSVFFKEKHRNQGNWLVSALVESDLLSAF
ncbi:TRM8 [Hirschfeldia incana]|nr:TRM8 [Hirschfeldia incana]